MQVQLITTDAYDKKMAQKSIGNDSLSFTGPLVGAKLRLGTNNPGTSKSLKFTDFTEADYLGYAGSTTMTFNAPVRESDGSYSVISGNKQFQASGSDSITHAPIAAVLLCDGSDTPTLLGYGYVSPSIDMNTTDAGFDAGVTINQGKTSVDSQVSVDA